jgi:hypothetical protein
MKTRLAIGMLMLVACGGAAEQSPRSPEPLEPEPRTVDEAQAQIARARSQLGGSEPAAKTESRPEKDAAPVTPAPAAGGSKEKEESPCASSCRALASMERAVAALCRMTGEQDERCRSARRTLDESVATTRSCSCH